MSIPGVRAFLLHRNNYIVYGKLSELGFWCKRLVLGLWLAHSPLGLQAQGSISPQGHYCSPPGHCRTNSEVKGRDGNKHEGGGVLFLEGGVLFLRVEIQ